VPLSEVLSTGKQISLYPFA